MTVTLDPQSPALTAARTHHDDLRAGLTELAESFIATVADGAPTRAARDRLVSFLRTELLPHAESEETLLYNTIRTPATGLLIRAIHDEHRMMAALINEVEQGRAMEAAIAAGALVVLVDVRIEQENTQLLPALAAAGLDLGGLLGDHPEIVGSGDDHGSADPGPTRSGGLRSRTLDLRGLDYYNRRHALYTELRALAPGEEVRLISERQHDLSWLRYEMEERIAQRFSWTTETKDAVPYTVIRRPERWSD